MAVAVANLIINVTINAEDNATSLVEGEQQVDHFGCGSAASGRFLTEQHFDVGLDVGKKSVKMMSFVPIVVDDVVDVGMEV